MKNLLAFALLATVLTFASCGKDDEGKKDDSPIVDDNPDPKDELVELTGNLSSQTLTADKKYLIKGQVFVGDNVTLTIEPGTVLLGDKRTRGVLVIDKGGKLDAIGTVDKPIVFTSNQEAGIRDRGDWGGVVILGRANTNQNNPAIEGITPEKNFGTNNSTANDGESSGTLKYVRVEFAGIELTPNNETNSITMGSVGRGTTMEYCMVSFGGDDGFEWFGGTVNGKYFICHATWDDDYDVDFGYSGNVQFGLGIRYPGYADQSQSNGFECDNGPNDNDALPYTTGVFCNFTIIGPIAEGSKVSNSNFAHAMDLRRRTSVSIVNSVFTGYPIGLRMNQPSVLEQYADKGNGIIDNNVIVTLTGKAYAAGSGVEVSAVGDYVGGRNNVIEVENYSLTQSSELGLSADYFYKSGQLASDFPSSPKFEVTSGTLTSGAKFSDNKFSEENRSGFFQEVSYIGAFGGTNWTAGWAEFAPVDKEY